jgi:hypothetical protein
VVLTWPGWARMHSMESAKVPLVKVRRPYVQAGFGEQITMAMTLWPGLRLRRWLWRLGVDSF